jgi:L-fuculose-phosphate aldolase
MRGSASRVREHTQNEGGFVTATDITSDIDRLRDELARYGRKVLEERLATGAGGNISARCGDTMLISPSGLSLEDTLPEQYVAVSLSSGLLLDPTALRPSSEVLMHLAIYRKRPDVNAVVHTHPQYTIALSSSGHDLKPLFADSIIYLGQVVPHLDYITVTTPELAAAVEMRMGSANCIVLRNHGAITLGENLKHAFWRACTLEETARIQLLATLVGKPRFLDANEATRLEALSSEQYRRELIARMIG